MSDIQAIHIDSDSNGNERVERKLPAEIKLSVFTFPYRWDTWRGFWSNIREFFYAICAGWHRATKGYCRADCWNADLTISYHLIQILTEYRNVTRGWPDRSFDTFEEWIAYIDEIIDLLIYSQEDPDKISVWHDAWLEKCCGIPRSKWGEEENNILENYRNEVFEIERKQREAQKKAFEMLGEHLHEIWY